jgi:anti-anti-sigma factor
VLLPPEIDIANADSVRKDLMTAIGRGSTVVIADLSHTSFCDCAGVSALMTAGGLAARSGSELRVVARSRPVLRTFELTGLSQCVRVYASGAEATRDPGSGSEGGAQAGAVLNLRPRAPAGESGQPPGQRQSP